MKLLCPSKKFFSKEIKSFIPKKIVSKFLNLNQLSFDKLSSNYEIILMRFNLYLRYKKNHKIRFILTPTTGLNHIDKKYFSDKKVKIISLKNEINFLNKVRSTVEFSILLLLLAMRNYKNLKKQNMEGAELYKKKIGIIGYGRIGQKVERIVKSFEADVFINDKKKKYKLRNNFKNLNFILKNCDIIMLHIPLEKNSLFLDKKQLLMLKKNSTIVNTSRGEILNEKILKSIMKKKSIKYYTDVITNEHNPKTNNFLSINDKSLFFYSYHQAGLSKESTFKTEKFIIKKFVKIWKKIKN